LISLSEGSAGVTFEEEDAMESASISACSYSGPLSAASMTLNRDFLNPALCLSKGFTVELAKRCELELVGVNFFSSFLACVVVEVDIRCFSSECVTLESFSFSFGFLATETSASGSIRDLFFADAPESDSWPAFLLYTLVFGDEVDWTAAEALELPAFFTFDDFLAKIVSAISFAFLLLPLRTSLMSSLVSALSEP
jgi:hypothetical protein